MLHTGKHFQPGQWTKICSRHFEPSDFYNFWSGYRTLREDAVPSIFAFTTNKTTARRQLIRVGLEEGDTASIDLSSVDQTVNVDQSTDQNDVSDTIDTASASVTNVMEVTAKTQEEVNRVNAELAKATSEITTLKQMLTAKTQEVNRLNAELAKATSEITTLKQMLTETRMEAAELKEDRCKFCIEAIRGSDKDVHFYTGLPSATVFDKLLEYLSPEGKRSNVVYRATAKKWSDDGKEAEPGKAEWRESEASIGRPANLSQANEFFLMLVRLRLNLKEHDLAKRFDISQSSVSRIFTTWINYCYLRLGMLPCWPDRITIKNTMPAIFKEKYPNTTVIVDATEIKVNTPSSLLLQSQTFSSYKSSNTFKALLGVSPAGYVMFVSSLYTGSISDTQLVEKSGFLTLLQQGDEVMADRGFTIRDVLAPLGVGLNIPPFLGDRTQLSGPEVVETQQIASLRIHVERAIRRVKEFDILAGILPASLSSSANQIWTVCCLLTNFQNPLLSC